MCSWYSLYCSNSAVGVNNGADSVGGILDNCVGRLIVCLCSRSSMHPRCPRCSKCSRCSWCSFVQVVNCIQVDQGAQGAQAVQGT